MHKLLQKQKAYFVAPVVLALSLLSVAPAYASGGYTWSQANGSTYCNSFEAASGTGQYALCSGGSGSLYVSTDYSANFNPVNSGNHDWDALGVSGNGQYMVGVTDSQGIYLSSDYGVTWSSVYSSNVTWNSVAISGTGQYITATTGTDLYSSMDYGVTWSQTYSFPSSAAVAMSSSGQHRAVVVASDDVYTSADYGATWVDQTSSGARNWGGLSMGSTGQYLAVAEYGGDIYTSSNYGASWVQRPAAGSRNWFGLAISSEGTKLIAADNDVGSGGVYVSSDSGQTWIQDPNLPGGSYAHPVGSYDLSREMVLGPPGLYTGSNPSFYVPSNQVSSVTPSANQTSATRGTAATITAPNTGYGKPTASLVPALIWVSLSSLVLVGDLSLRRHQKALLKHTTHS